MDTLPKSKRLVKYVDFQPDQLKANFEKNSKETCWYPC